MTLRTTVRFASFALVLSAVGVAAVSSRAADDAPVVSIKDVMNACNHPEYGLFAMIKATMKTDCTPKDWKIIGYRAGMMAEAGNTLARLTPPRGADDEAGLKAWKDQAAAYREAAKALRSAANAKNKDDAAKAVATLGERCAKCHEVHQNE